MLYTKFNKNYTFEYIFIHIVLGVILSFKTIPLNYRITLLTIIILYQLGQLALKKRYFLDTNSFKDGNSISHTINKLSHFYLGYLLGKTII